MSKAEIMRELPKLGSEERREIFELICEIEERDLLKGGGPSAEEKQMLDRELEAFRFGPEARASWAEIEVRLRKQRKS